MKGLLPALLVAPILLILIALASTAWAQRGDTVIIDVRTIEEWNTGHLATAQHLQLELVGYAIDTLVSDKEQQLYLYCRSGNRSGQAKLIMEQLGYSNVVNAGGLDDASQLLDVAIVR